MATPVIMPRQGQSVETCIITEWVKKIGESVKKGDILFAYETDKASFEAEAEVDGTLLDVFYKDGDEVPVLINVAVIGNPGEATDVFRQGAENSEAKTETNQKAEPAEKAQEQTKSSESNDISASQKIKISPRARVMAEKNGVNIFEIKGSGPLGRIIASDIEKAKAQKSEKLIVETTTKSVETPVYTPPAASNIYSDNDFNINKLSNVRKLIAKAMHESISNSAQLTHHMSADVRKLQALRD